MNPNAEQIINEPSNAFVPVLIHADELPGERRREKATTLETLQITLAFIVGSAMTLFTLLL